MARLISGGRKPTEPIPARLLRNVAKLPTLAYEAGTTGLGLGNVTNLLADRLENKFEQIGVPAPAARFLTNISPLRLLNTTEQARNQVGKVLPAYMTESRKGDAPYEFLVRDAPLAAASGGLSTLGRAAQTVGTAAGLYAGSALGEQLGRKAGQAVGEEQLGAALGSLGGGFAGSAGVRGLINRPSKIIPPKVQEKIETKRTTGLQNLEQEAQKRSTRMKELNETRGPLYEQAAQAGKNVYAESAPQLKEALKKVSSQLDAGIEKADLRRIGDISGQVERFANQKRINLNDAINLKQNLNTSLYDRNLPPMVRKAVTQYRNALSEFIDTVGQEKPELGQPFRAAESKTIELKNLQKTQPEFAKAQKAAKQLIETEYKQALKKPEVIKIIDQYVPEKVKNVLPSVFSFSLGGTAGKLLGINPLATSAAVGIGTQLYNEGRVLQTAYQNHPEIFADYKQLLKAAIKQDIPRLTSIATTIDTKLPSKTQPKLIRGGRIKR